MFNVFVKSSRLCRAQQQKCPATRGTSHLSTQPTRGGGGNPRAGGEGGVAERRARGVRAALESRFTKRKRAPGLLCRVRVQVSPPVRLHLAGARRAPETRGQGLLFAELNAERLEACLKSRAPER